jgi:hypothetical protein
VVLKNTGENFEAFDLGMAHVGYPTISANSDTGNHILFGPWWSLMWLYNGQPRMSISWM